MSVMHYVKWIVFGALALAGLLLLAFGPRPAADRPPDRVIVQYWEKWVGNEAAQMQQIVNDFNATVGKAKGIYVEYLSMSSVNQKTLVATAAGVPPDVAGVWDGQVAQYAAINAIEPLDSYVAAHNATPGEYQLTPSYYKPVYWNACTYRGQLYALISTPASVLLHYNKKLFAEKADKLKAAGCDPTRAPRTLAELDRYAAALTEYKDGKLVCAGYIPAEPGWYKVHTPLWFGGELFDPATQRFTLTSPECIAAFQWWQNYSQRLGKDALTEFRQSTGATAFNSTQNPFYTGQVAMVQQGPWMANYIQDLVPEWNNPAVKGIDRNTPEGRKKFDALMTEYYKLPVEKRRELASWGVAPFPSIYSDQLSGEDLVDKGVTFCGFDVLVIPRGAKHPREAFEFIAYVNRLEVMEKICRLHCKNTPLSRHSADWYKNHPNPYIELFDRMADSPRAHAVPSVPIWPEVDAEMGSMIDRVTLMTQDAPAALEQARARLQASLDKFNQRQAQRGKAVRAEE